MNTNDTPAPQWAVEAAKEIHSQNKGWCEDKLTLNENTLAAIIARHAPQPTAPIIPKPISASWQKITPENQPVFPCWLWTIPARKVGFPQRVMSERLHNPDRFGGRSCVCTHWHPDQPTAPTAQPEQPEQTPYIIDERAQEHACGPAVSHSHDAFRYAGDEHKASKPAATGTPDVAAVAKLIGSFAARYRSGQIHVYDFVKWTEDAMDGLRQLETELAEAKRDTATAMADYDRTALVNAELRRELAEARAERDAEADGLTECSKVVFDLRTQLTKASVEINDLRGCGMVAPADFGAGSWAELKAQLTAHSGVIARLKEALVASKDMLVELHHDHADNWPKEQIEHLKEVGETCRTSLALTTATYAAALATQDEALTALRGLLEKHLTELDNVWDNAMAAPACRRAAVNAFMQDARAHLATERKEDV